MAHLKQQKYKEAEQLLKEILAYETDSPSMTNGKHIGQENGCKTQRIDLPTVSTTLKILVYSIENKVNMIQPI